MRSAGECPGVMSSLAVMTVSVMLSLGVCRGTRYLIIRMFVLFIEIVFNITQETIISWYIKKTEKKTLVGQQTVYFLLQIETSLE